MLEDGISPIKASAYHQSVREQRKREKRRLKRKLEKTSSLGQEVSSTILTDMISTNVCGLAEFYTLLYFVFDYQDTSGPPGKKWRILEKTVEVLDLS